MKFAVLSLNPGIDRSLYLPSSMKCGELNRTVRSVTSHGSKGANVAIMLSKLGCEVEYYSFTGGVYGEINDLFISRESESSPGKIIPHYVTASCGVRVNTKVIDSEGCCTELNERGGPFTQEETEELIRSYLSSDADVFCLCGSIPQGVENSVYNSIISRLKSTGKVTVLDCDGEALRQGIKAKPDFIKPNLFELSAFLKSTGLCESFSADVKDEPENVVDACGKLLDKYGTGVLCTMGESGAVAVTADGNFLCPAAKVKLRGFSAAGDCFLAGFMAAKYEYGFDMFLSLATASACGGAKIELEGSYLPEKDRVDELSSSLAPMKI